MKACFATTLVITLTLILNSGAVSAAPLAHPGKAMVPGEPETALSAQAAPPLFQSGSLQALPTGYPLTPYETYSPGSGTTYYLDAVNGNDLTGDGSLATPWQTLDKALATVTSGDTVILRAGDYGEFKDWTSAGSDDWITFRSFAGEQAAFSSGVSLRYATGQADAFFRFDGILISVNTNTIVDIYRIRNVEFRNCVLRGADKYLTEGVKLAESENVLFYHNVITNVLRGISMSASRNVTFGANHLYQLGGGTAFQYAGGNENTVIERNNAHDSVWNPADPNAPTDPVHASAISIRSNDVLIRENIFHNIGSSSGIMFYTPDAAGGETAYRNITIENNLLYDIQNVYVLRMYNLGDNVVVRNNTVVSTIRSDTNYGASRLNTALAVHTLAAGYDGSGLFLYNNIFIGAVDLPANSVSRNNIVWSYHTIEGGDTYWCTPPDPSSVVLTCSDAYPVDYFTDGFFVQTPVFDYGHGQALDFHLATGSPAAGFGYWQDQPAFGLGSLDAQGFILAEGLARNSAWHSAGCYELPGLTLRGTPANQSIHLDWSSNASLPITSTWQIDYQSWTGTAYLPVTGILSPTRAYTLTGLTNNVWYTVTLTAVGVMPPLTASLRVMPAGIFVYLPLVLKSEGEPDCGQLGFAKSK